MFRKLVLLSIMPFIFACQQKQKANSTESIDSSIIVPNVMIDTGFIKDPLNIKNNESVINYRQGDLLLANAAYRIGEANEIGKILNHGNWLMLYKEQGRYKIDKAQYSLIEEDEEPCSGMPTQTLETERNSLLFFNIPNIKVGVIDTVVIKNRVITPNKALSFTFNGHSYKLEATGTDPLKQNFRDIPNAYYQLTLTVDNVSKEILYQTQYSDTNTEILFIGDLDKDGKLDFILSSPRDYEEQRIILILSSEPIHYEETRQFDC